MAAMSLTSGQAGASEMLWEFWYPALRSEQVHRHKLTRAMLLEAPLVLGRDSAGKPFAMRDICPHRAFPLSFGQFDGKNVECAYHGWKFDAHTGQCEERDGYIWAFMTNAAGRGLEQLPPPAPQLRTFSASYKIAHLYADLPC